MMVEHHATGEPAAALARAFRGARSCDLARAQPWV